MIDLWILALGFGVLPFVALPLYNASTTLRRHEALVWGLLVGVLAFLGLAHAGAALLEGNALLRDEASPAASALAAAGGVFVGVLLGWRLLGKADVGSTAGASLVLWAAVVYVALHSFTDGLVLGEAYAGPVASGYTLTAATVGGTILHRLAEGSLIVVPAIFASWRPPKSIPFLLVGLVTLPAAYVPVALLASGIFSPASVAFDQGIAVFAAGLEAGFALLFLLLGLIPHLRGAKDGRWAVWAGVAFIALLLVHFLVE